MPKVIAIGRIDVVVNNAGYGMGPLEKLKMKKNHFDTNFGPIEVMKAVPQMQTKWFNY
jgi:NAD(P)-dependent dehydrogenase (short-subunit alcohol dehydrogenase family)